MSEYIKETRNGKTKHYLIMYNVALADGTHIEEYKQPVSRTEYNNYHKARAYIKTLKEARPCG